MSEEIQPALSGEEWESRTVNPHEEATAHVAGDGKLWLTASDGGSLLVVRPAALAALCLHGQPYGFTWEDVDALRAASDALDAEHGWPGEVFDHPSGETDGSPNALHSLADRIAALLPPAKEP